MHTEEYWGLLKARSALGKLSVREVMEVIGMNQNNICNKMRNSARAIRKELYIGDVSESCFLSLMNDVDFSVRNWDVIPCIPGDLSKFKFHIEGHHLYYREKETERKKCSYPYACNTTYDCKYAEICESPLAIIQINCDQSVEWIGKTPFVSRTINGNRVTKKARVKPKYKYQWYD